MANLLLLFPSVKEVADFTYETFAFAQKDNLIALSNDQYTIVVPTHGRYGKELERIFYNATDVIGPKLLTTQTPYTTHATPWDTEVLQGLIAETKTFTKKLTEPVEADVACDAIINFRLYRACLKSLKPDVLRKYHTTTAPAAKIALDAATAVVDPDAVEVKLSFPQMYRQIVVTLSGDNDRFVSLSKPGYDESVEAAKLFGTDEKKAAAIIEGCDLGLSAVQIAKKYRLNQKETADLVVKWKTAHSALETWQPRQAAEAAKSMDDIKAKVLIELNNRIDAICVNGAAKAQPKWDGEALIIHCNSALRDEVLSAATETMSHGWSELRDLALTVETHGQTINQEQGSTEGK
jgi:hypothetical protein